MNLDLKPIKEDLQQFLARQYYVKTWDLELERFTPQKGVKVGPYSLFGLRIPLRKLQRMGYDTGKGDPSVLVMTDRSRS